MLAEIRKLIPNAPVVYAADSAGYPYGTRSPAEIAARVPALLGRLAERYDPSLIVIACNTASTIALDAVRAALDLPIVGTVPAIKPAAERSATRTIGVLGTDATVVQPYVDRLADRFAADCKVIRHGSAELVELAEAKLRGEPADEAAYARILGGLIGQPGGEQIDTIVLACTHFPLVEAELAAAAPRPLAFVDGKEGIARRTAWLTRDHVWPDRPSEGVAVFTGPADRAEAYRPGFAALGLTRIESSRPGTLLRIVRTGLPDPLSLIDASRKPGTRPLDYQRIFAEAIERLHAEGRYRVFIEILRNKGSFPNARCFAGHNGPKPITVWCSNDYLAMGQHPDVIAAMEEALHDVGAGSGGTRNISRQQPLSYRARGRARRPPRQGSRAALHLGLHLERGDLVDARQDRCPAASSSPTR